MKKLLLIIALTLTANARANVEICNIHLASLQASMSKGLIEVDYGTPSSAKIYFVSALRTIQDAKEPCSNRESAGIELSRAEKWVRIALDRLK